MSDREKLIGLFYENNVRCDQTIEKLVDDVEDVIANGVTVQQWIPVSERLPKPFVTVLVHIPTESPCPTVVWGFLTDSGLWHANFFDREKDEVTHWMPLPQPPKGEQ